jgi:hypothetical protein
MKVFSELVSEHDQMLLRTEFLKLLEAMYAKTIAQDEGYFSTLEAPIRILKQVMSLAS